MHRLAKCIYANVLVSETHYHFNAEGNFFFNFISINTKNGQGAERRVTLGAVSASEL